jgi:putative ABC transport system ATP-binding protein
MLIKDKNIDIDEILDTVGLSDKKNSYPKNLSGGEQQRVSIARALSKNFDILFCDEPTGSLDSNTSKQILLLLEKLCKKNKKTIVIVTHNNDICKIANRVYSMKNGEIVEEKTNKKPLSVNKIEW